VIRLEQLTKVYGDVTVLDRVDFSVASGEIFAIVGPSGAGKSTLASCITLLERPTSGSVIVNGDDLSHLAPSALRAARRRIGTIFQHDGLFSRRTAAQNVALPLEYLGVTRGEAKSRVAELLERVGLSHRADYYPHELSGGQRQRVGIARALALRPSVLICDEATSGLDPDATASVVRLLKELRDDLDLAIVFVSHEMDTVLSVADSVARLDRGRIVESGALVDLLLDPDSELGRSLRPARGHGAAPVGSVTWFVKYGTDHVPGDWASRVAAELGGGVHLLGASVETVHGLTVGHATVAVETDDDDSVVAAFRALGLDARRTGSVASEVAA
jgi:D-methionine transport system ATP-binding protein